ncbi:MAG: YraN family protein [Oligoflexia bacterium]|nr:YraN family protein [Oligoflexia bacterium]
MLQQSTEPLFNNWGHQKFTEKASAELKSILNNQDYYLRGKAGEQFVTTFLVQRGFNIFSQNLKTPYGEIDLIVTKDATLYIFEIKTRAGSSVFVKEPVMYSQKKRLKKAATWVWQKNRQNFKNIKCCLATLTHGGIKWKNLSLLYDSN